MKRKYRWGALLAPQRMFERDTQDLLQAVRGNEESMLVGIGCPAHNVNRRMSDHFAASVFSEHYEDLITRDDIDIVYIATEQASKSSLTKACLNYQKAVVVEAPIASNLPNAQEIYACGKKQGVVVLEAIPMCFLPVVQRLVRLVKARELGDIVSLYADASVQRGLRLNDDAVVKAPTEDIFLRAGRYPLALGSLLFGVPVEVSGYTTKDPAMTNTQYVLTLAHEQGVFSSLVASSLVTGCNEALINGTKKRVQVGYPFYGKSVVKLFSRQRNVGLLDFSYQQNLCDPLVTGVHKVLQTGEKESPCWTQRDSLAFVQTLQLCLEHAMR